MADRRRALGTAAVLSSLLSGALTGYAWWESTRVKATQRALTVPDLPAGLVGLRILHLSDTHFPADGASLERFADLAARLEYDIVFATGDYVETSAGWGTALDAFSLLHAPFGVWATLGAHDWLAPVRTPREWLAAAHARVFRGQRRLVNAAPFVEQLEALGVRVLRNRWDRAEIGGEVLRIAGAGDDSAGMAQLEAALPSAAEAEGGLTVLLTHSADALLRLERPPPLVFAGHTHGGQIRLPGYGAPVRHSRLTDRRRAAGVFSLRGSQVVISQGFGTAVVPLRLLCRPEVSVIELQR